MRPQAPRVLAAATALVCAALLASCGKVNPTPAASTVTTHPGTGTTPREAAPPAPSHERPLTQAQAHAFASAVNLRAADVPGFVPSVRAATGGFGGEKRLEEQLARCAGASGSARAGPAEAGSPVFRRRGALLGDSVSSSVSFLSSAAAGAQELAVLRSERLRTCLSRYLDALLRGRQFGGATLGNVSIVEGTPPAPGTTGGFGWRVTAVFTIRRLRVPFYLDTLGFIDRRAEVTLQSSGAALPFPAAAEEHLFNLLLERAKRQHL